MWQTGPRMHSTTEAATARARWSVAAVDSYRQEHLAEAERIANVGSWELDFATERRVFSEQFCRIFGLPPDAEPEIAELQEMERAAREALQPVSEQLRFTLPDGSVRTIVFHARVVRHDDGDPLRLIGVVQDVTERVAHEEELHRIAVLQAAVANLGQIALSGASLDFLLNQVTALLPNLLDVDLCHILQKRAGGELRLMSGSSPSARPMVATLTVTIESSDDRPWGILGVHTSTPRTFSAADAEFLRSIAAVLAQAIERDRVDAERRTRALQQSAIAEVGRAVLTKLDGNTLNRICELVARGLGVDVADFLAGDEAVPDGALCVPVASAACTFGALVARPRAGGAFTGQEIEYVESIANILAEAMEREESQASRQQLTRRLELLLESTLEGICTIDAQGRCTMINAAAARMIGQAADTLLGVQMHALVHSKRPDGSPYPQSECPIGQVLLTRKAFTIQNDVFWRADGTPFPVSYSVAPIFDGLDVIGAVVAFRDVTERSTLEQKLEQANRLSSLGRLAATVAHEFNNVLMGIAPFIEVIRRKPERIASALDQMTGAVARGKRITEEILRFTRPAELVRADFAVEPWLRAVASEALNVLSARHHVVIEYVDESLRVYADRNQLHQIVSNVIVNARDAMPGGGTITITARREEPGARFAFGFVERPERFIHIAVADTGSGMSEETLRHIFEPLFTTKTSGTGLGLAVAHQVVERHGGEIFAESALGAGTTFHLFIPIAEGQSAAPVAVPSAPSVPRARHLLLVDDDEVIVSGLVALLELEGIKVDAVTTGRAAIDFLRDTTPDVVLLDVGLPDIDGTDVYAHIAATKPELPVVFSTGHADTAGLHDLADRRHVVSLLKPYDLETLLEAIERAVG